MPLWGSGTSAVLCLVGDAPSRPLWHDGRADGEVALTCRAQPAQSPGLYVWRPLTMADYLISPMLASPFAAGLLLETDGCACGNEPERARTCGTIPCTSWHCRAIPTCR